jgi:hypothetical protein
VSDRGRALDRALAGLFRGLAARPAPEHVLRTVELLDEIDRNDGSPTVFVPTPEVSKKKRKNKILTR